MEKKVWQRLNAKLDVIRTLNAHLLFMVVQEAQEVPPMTGGRIDVSPESIWIYLAREVPGCKHTSKKVTRQQHGINFILHNLTEKCGFWFIMHSLFSGNKIDHVTAAKKTTTTLRIRKLGNAYRKHQRLIEGLPLIIRKNWLKCTWYISDIKSLFRYNCSENSMSKLWKWLECWSYNG